MKKVLFGIAVILFAILLILSQLWLPVIGGLLSSGEFALLVGVIGLVIAGLGVCKKDK